MRAPLPPLLPDRLPAYLPGRIAVVPDEFWELRDTETTSLGIRIHLPRYGLDLRTRDVQIDPSRIRWLTERTTTRPLDARHVHLRHHRGFLHVVDGHHTLAAHLVTGSEHIPARLIAPVGA
jgi:hypothetical protein